MKAKPPQDHRPTRLARGPFARPLNVNDVKSDALSVTVEAAAEDLPAIAEAVGLPSVQSLKVEYKLFARSGGRFDLVGDLKANITQICVVTLEPFASDVTQAIDLTFAQPIYMPDVQGADRRRRNAPTVDVVVPRPVPGSDDQDDPADPIVADTIDLGAVALEFLTLACDLYPRKPGVAFSDLLIGDTDEPEPSAFAVLDRLKDRS